MRTLFASVVFFFLTTAQLSAQIVPPPAQARRAAQQSAVYLIKFRDGTPAADRAASIQASGARLRRGYAASNAASVEVPNEAALARLRNDPRIVGVFSNQAIHLDVQGRGGGSSNNGKPKTPENLTATAVSSSQINVSWADVSNNEDGFALERCAGVACSNFSEIIQVGANVVTFADSGRAPQTTYRYRVLAFNAAGNSKYSNIAEATTPAAPPPPPPLAPGNLIASAPSYSQVDLSWSDNSNNETGFQVERCVGPSASCTTFTQIASLSANITGLSDLNVTGSSTYTYRVRAFNGNGSSGYSNFAQVTTPATPPPPPPVAPSNLSTSAPAYNQVNLNWSDNSSDESGFQVERCGGTIATCSTFVQIAETAANATGFSDPNVTGQNTYTYRVRAFNNDGPSTFSNPSEVTTPAAPPPPPPAAPGNLTALASAHDQVNLSWSDNSADETGFKVERCTGVSATCTAFVEIAQTSSNITGLSDLGVAAQTTYTYRVSAFNNNGQSAYSNTAQMTTPAPPPPPPPVAPSNLSASAPAYNHVELIWSDNSNDETGFQIERCTGAMATCASFAQIAQLGPDSMGLSDFGVVAQTTYTYRVRAINGSGPSAFSNSTQVTTPNSPPSTQVVPSGVQRIGAAPGAFGWTGTGVGVAVVDTGLDYAHEDLALQPEVPNVNSYNAVTPGDTCQDIHGHGTHVAGIIGARNNLIDVVGVAPNTTIYCVNVFKLDDVEGVIGTDEDLIAGLEWILANANVVVPHIRVINMSLGRERLLEDDNPNHPLHVIVRALHDSGISVVVAAGNDATREVINEVPAFYPEVMAVASTTAQNGANGIPELGFPPCAGEQPIKADVASYFTTDGRFVNGTGVTISAPGEDREDIFDFGGCLLESFGILSLASGGGTVELSGTSMASPHVAGVVALMWEKEMSLGLSLAPETARTRIRANAIRRGTAPKDSPLAEYTFDLEREGILWAPSALLETPPPPVDAPPTVTITSPANNSSFSSGTSISFAATATDPEDGNIASALHWTSSRDGQIGTGPSFSRTLSSGNHVITASVEDSGENPGSASISLTVGSPSTPTSVHVSSVTFSFQGTTLFYTFKLVNEFGAPVSGATIRASLYEWVFTGTLWFTNGVTDAQGNVRFQLNNADFGCYTALAENITKPGLIWSPTTTPDNNYCRL
jgi:subtilisin family serine protease